MSSHCAVMRCPNAGEQVLALEDASRHIELLVCPQHHGDLAHNRIDWLYDDDQHVIYTDADDLSGDHSWLVEGHELAVREEFAWRFSSTPEATAALILPVRRRGSREVEELRIFVTPQQIHVLQHLLDADFTRPL